MSFVFDELREVFLEKAILRSRAIVKSCGDDYMSAMRAGKMGRMDSKARRIARHSALVQRRTFALARVKLRLRTQVA